MPQINPTFMSTEEVCTLLSLSKQALWRAVRAHQIPHQRFSEKGRIKFVRRDIEQFVRDHSYKAAGTTDS